MLCVVESISWNSILPTTLRFCWCHGLFLFFVASINTFMASSQGSVTHGLVTSDGMDLWCPIFILLSSDEICFHFLWVLCVIHLDALLLSLHCYAPVHQCTLRGHVNFPFTKRTLLRSLHILPWSIATHKLRTLMQVACTPPTTNATLYHSLARGTAVSNFHAI